MSDINTRTTHLLTNSISELRRQAESLAGAASDYAAEIACTTDSDLVKVASSRGLHPRLLRAQQHLQYIIQLEAALATIHSLGLAKVDVDDVTR